jgi:hypothetical protein
VNPIIGVERKKWMEQFGSDENRQYNNLRALFSNCGEEGHLSNFFKNSLLKIGNISYKAITPPDLLTT